MNLAWLIDIISSNIPYNEINKFESHHCPGWHWGDGEGQGSLACCIPSGGKESDTTEWLNNGQQPSLKGGNQWRDFMGGSGECSLRHKSRRFKFRSWSFRQDLGDLVAQVLLSMVATVYSPENGEVQTEGPIKCPSDSSTSHVIRSQCSFLSSQLPHLPHLLLLTHQQQ